MVHETAHQWFGDAVTESDWNDVWLSEGFATYFTLLYTEYAAGRDAFVDGLRRSRNAVLRLEKALPNTPVVHANLEEAGDRAEQSARLSKRRVDAAHAARPDRHGAVLARHQALLPASMNGLASTADLRRAMEEVSGQDLRWFFAQWLTRSGVPQLIGAAWRYDAAAKQVVVTVRQTQTADPYEFALDVAVTPASGPGRTVKLQMQGRAVTATVSIEAEPASVTLDPNVWLLAEFGAFRREQ